MLAFAGMILGTTFAVGAAIGLCVGAGLSPSLEALARASHAFWKRKHRNVPNS